VKALQLEGTNEAEAWQELACVTSLATILDSRHTPAFRLSTSSDDGLIARSCSCSIPSRGQRPGRDHPRGARTSRRTDEGPGTGTRGGSRMSTHRSRRSANGCPGVRVIAISDD